MSLLDRLFGSRLPASGALAPNVQLPYAPSAELQSLVYRDIYGSEDTELITREVAMTVSPVKKARAVIVGRCSDLPLQIGEMVEGRFVPDANQPAWLTTTGDVSQTPWHRMAWTFDDVLFTGWSLWTVERDESGAITDAERVARHRWQFDTASPTGVAIDWFHVTDPTSVILYCGPDAGLLSTARDTIAGWRHMERSWVGRVRNPIPLVVLREAQPDTVTQDEAKRYVDMWATGRTSANGMIGFLPAKLELDVHGQVEADLYDKGRNASRIDIANQVNLPVSYLDGSTATASLTYVTQEGDRQGLVDDLEYWLAPIEARLSMSDLTGNERKVIRFNRSNLTTTPNDTHGAQATPATPPAIEAAAPAEEATA
ncbi:hypothetical protein ABC195_09420 [Microbacterium sp. 2P01SA-2]|uniref:hypothetical protein n=1 Tax=unclassified Microbacterium TaxID=2609290 RepID=UPI0039A30C8E